MKISCPACSAKYSIADDKVQDRLAKIRCRKCGATIVIDGKTSPPHVYTGSGDAPDAAEATDSGAGSTEYSVDFGEGDQRTLPLRELVQAYNSGQVTGETFVWAEGFADWKPLADVAEIVAALNAGPVAAAPSPWEQKAAAKPAASAVPRSAARTASRSATADLFGSIDTAGSEDDVATSAPEPHSPIGTPSNASATGARNESSVLFSLSALTSAAQQPSRSSSTRAAANGSASRDDSGLIDLKALTAAAMKTETSGAAQAAAPIMPMVAPVSPLGVAPPLGLAQPAFAQFPGGADMPQQKSKAPLIVGALLGVGMLAIAGAILLKPDPPPPPPPPPPVVVQAPPPPAPTPPPAAEVAKPPATGTGAEAPPDKAAPKAIHRPVGGGGAPKKTTPAPTGGGDTAKPAAPAPKKSACGCASGDLQCAMRCAAKGG